MVRMHVATAAGAARKGEQAAEKAAANPAVNLLGQVGILARALVVFAIAGIGVEIIRGGGGRSADSKGALEALAATPVGLVLLVLVAVAFAGHALWRVLEAATGLHRDSGEKRTLKRLWFGWVAVLYAGLCVETVRLIVGHDGGSENATSHRATSDVLGLPGGRVVTGLAGLAVIGIGIGVGVWALRGNFLAALHIERLGPRLQRAVRWIGAAGQASRAAVIALAGLLLVDAAVADDPSRAQGLDGTLRTLAGRPYGTALLAVTCAGLALFGVYSVAQALLLRTSRDDAAGRG